MPAPTFVAEYDSNDWVTARASGTVYTCTSVAVQSGDILVVLGGSEQGGQTLSVPAGGGLTYTQRQRPNSGGSVSFSEAYIWTATATSTTSFNVTSTLTSGASKTAGIIVYVFRNAALGAPVSVGATNSGTAPSLAISTVSANSAVVMFNADWNAIDGASRTWRTINSITPTLGNNLERLYQRNALNWTADSAYWNDVGAAGSKTTGMTAPTGQQSCSVAIEIQGTAAAPTTQILLMPARSA